MKTLTVELPDQLARTVEDLIQAGWFTNEAELAHQALSDFVLQRRFQLQEQFQLDDICWALDLKGSAA